jgi:hypothetical protein
VKRRTLLAGVSALPFAGAKAAPAADSDFIAACVALAGTGAFPAFFAAAARQVLDAEFGPGQVAALVRAVNAWDGASALPPALEPIAQRLLTILYTGETRR